MLDLNFLTAMEREICVVENLKFKTTASTCLSLFFNMFLYLIKRNRLLQASNAIPALVKRKKRQLVKRFFLSPSLWPSPAQCSHSTLETFLWDQIYFDSSHPWCHIICFWNQVTKSPFSIFENHGIKVLALRSSTSVLAMSLWLMMLSSRMVSPKR